MVKRTSCGCFKKVGKHGNRNNTIPLKGFSESFERSLFKNGNIGMDNKKEPLWELIRLLFKAHPWHGVSIGADQPTYVTTYIEVVPSDTVKYELDKDSGILKVDRPQSFSNVCPTMYGMIPQTFCGETVSQYCEKMTGKQNIVGDDDPLDICVLSEKLVPRGDILLQAKPIGGLRMIDGGEADDKIVAVLKDDASYGYWSDIDDCPAAILDRLKHYFLTYKQVPGDDAMACEITHTYGKEEAYEVIRRSHVDYLKRFANIDDLLTIALRNGVDL
jgi:inorganic pyrophosphatase